MTATGSEDLEVFRAEVREFLDGYRDLDAFFGQGLRWPEVRSFFAAMGERGWLSLGWPEEHGGLGRGPDFEFALWDEVAYARAARNPLSAEILASSLARYALRLFWSSRER